MTLKEQQMLMLDQQIAQQTMILSAKKSDRRKRLFWLSGPTFFLFIIASSTLSDVMLEEWQKAALTAGAFIFFLPLLINGYFLFRHHNETFAVTRLFEAFEVLTQQRDIDKYLLFIQEERRYQTESKLLKLHYTKFAALAEQNLLQRCYELQLESIGSAYKLKDFDNFNKLLIKKSQNPLQKVKRQLNTTLSTLKSKREELQKQWHMTYQDLSWWYKLKYEEGPNFSEINNEIKRLETLRTVFIKKHGDQIKEIEAYFHILNAKSSRRLKQYYEHVLKCQEDKYLKTRALISEKPDRLLEMAGWSSAFGVSASLLEDFSTCHNVYDALRRVNSNYEGLSDSEIWWETLWMQEESLAQLASLTKEAYLNQLLVEKTDGVLFDHFNQTDSEIVIDSITYQIKKKKNKLYLETFDEKIPVITSREIAKMTALIGSAITHVSINVDVDFSEEIADGILSDIGGFGLFASLKGLGHAAEKYNKGGDGEEAIYEGIEIAIVGSAKAIVDTGELVYKAAMSGPSRFIGRSILKGLYKLDKKLTD